VGFAAARHHSLLELAVSWLATQPGVASVIAGARTVEQVKTNASAAGWALTPAELDSINAILG
jgi:aryl-alcohol dehydrogenase-like predicted oxidoreductase